MTKPIDSESSEEDIDEKSALAAVKFILNKKILKLTPFVLCRGMNAANQASVWVNFWVYILTNTLEGANYTKDEKIEKGLYTFMMFGAGCILGASILGVI